MILALFGKRKARADARGDGLRIGAGDDRGDREAAQHEVRSRQLAQARNRCIGITYRNTAPLYLLDGEDRIMISEALNLSDRLSGCSKLACKSLTDTRRSVFNVFVLQTISEETAAGAMEEFLVRYNVNGICLSEDAFDKLRHELNFSTVEVDLPLLWGKEKVILHSGAVPLSTEVYQRLVIREALVPFVDPQTFKMKEKTTRRYFELCTNKVVYDYTDKMIAGGG